MAVLSKVIKKRTTHSMDISTNFSLKGLKLDVMSSPDNVEGHVMKFDKLNDQIALGVGGGGSSIFSIDGGDSDNNNFHYTQR
jgi:hypothetical protein